MIGGSDNYIILTLLDKGPVNEILLKKLTKNLDKRLYDLKKMGCIFSYDELDFDLYLDYLPDTIQINHSTRSIRSNYNTKYRKTLERTKKIKKITTFISNLISKIYENFKFKN